MPSEGMSDRVDLTDYEIPRAQVALWHENVVHRSENSEGTESFM